MSWIRDRFWSHFVVCWVLTTAVLTRWGSGPDLGLHAIPLAVIASWAWTLHCVRDRRVQVADGFRAQHHTWNSLLRSHPPHDPSPLYREFVQRMSHAEQHLRAVARQYRLQRLSIAFTDGWHPDGDGNDAASISDGRRSHLWLGSNWFGPEETVHLPVVLEHELGHILRRDNQRATVLQAVGVLLVVMATAWLPLPVAVLTAAALRLLYIGWSWRSELACDARAARACGRDSVILLWRRNTELLRTLPRPTRLWHSLRSASTHPPVRLRIWWAQHLSAPAAPKPHPLAALPDTHDRIRPLAA
ncbi:M48 family metalloprotease [Streptomyces sp. NBC_01433]|uniref:M48 family metalloprotease n=2 Tax=Streptomyces sp. NBC_01433 TaxID=2903864 RepID=UPI00225BD6F2|nr:M48 family metalloprotease [Streptomyces sp. NBC_01433]MCX4681316.1 M48 family metalloprotease [Streptomyces sp. NBC_01433]MCX4682393.1 M48 family metalloprotease [Streptomyces sp. NBC_01433]